MGERTYDCLRLETQLCFPLYACSKEIIKRYKPFLDGLDLTYTQYITMMVLWEHVELTVKELGAHLYLDSGTLTPLLKKLEAKQYITRTRMAADERNVLIRITEQGMRLRERASSVPHEMAKCITLEPEDTRALYGLLHRLLDSFAAQNALDP